MIEATLCVTTQRRFDRHETGGYWLRLSEYGDMEEFYAACMRCFAQERTPQLRYAEWCDIPDELVRRDWLSPNLFEALDALSQLDGEDREPFLGWCRQNGHDIATDDAAELAARYLSLFGDCFQPDEEPPDDDTFYASDDCLCVRWRLSAGIFGDDYDC